MEPTSTYRPRVSRETRRLLTTGLLAVAALWLLARIRFEERLVTPNPVPAVFGQLAFGTSYDDLAEATARVRTRLEPSILAVTPSGTAGAAGTAAGLAALRFRGDLAVALQTPGAWADRAEDARVVVHDPTTALTVVRVAGWAPDSVPAPWTPRRAQQPRYLLATDVSPGGVSLRPVFVGAFDEVDSPLWAGPIWFTPLGSGLVPGSFVFTVNSELVGLVVKQDSGIAIVPGPTILAAAERLLAQPRQATATAGIEVQALTPALATLTGATAGVVVTWIQAHGGATGVLSVGDVIDEVDDAPIGTRLDWDARMARLRAGEAIRLRIRRDGKVQGVTVPATPLEAPAQRANLGLTLQRRSESGADVVRVEPGSAAYRAGLEPGDLITLVGDVAAPTPAQVSRAFAAAPEGQLVLVGVTRGTAHHVMVLER